MIITNYPKPSNYHPSDPAYYHAVEVQELVEEYNSKVQSLKRGYDPGLAYDVQVIEAEINTLMRGFVKPSALKTNANGYHTLDDLKRAGLADSSAAIKHATDEIKRQFGCDHETAYDIFVGEHEGQIPRDDAQPKTVDSIQLPNKSYDTLADLERRGLGRNDEAIQNAVRQIQDVMTCDWETAFDLFVEENNPERL